MSKANRLNRLDARRLELESEYTAALVVALKITASGKWGLFDHQADRHARAVVAPVVDNLTELAHAIDGLRETLSLPPFEVSREFTASRGPANPQAVGEPKQAQAWLDRLARSDAASGD